MTFLKDTDSPSRILRNGVAVISGAGTGLGQAMAVELTQLGLKVVGFGRRSDRLDETAKLCANGRFTGKTVDVSDAAAVSRAFAEINDLLGSVTILINNAAIYPHDDFLRDTPENFMKTIQINLGGTVSCTHAALLNMVQTGIGRIVNVGSYADLAPLPCSAAYSVSKGAGRIFTKALIADLSDRFPDIVMSTWMPGILATDMGLPDGLAPEKAARWGARLALWHDRSLNGTIFEQDQEILPPRSVKGRLKDLLLMRRPPRPRRIS